MNLPADSATLEALINEAVLSENIPEEELNALIAVLESAEIQLELPIQELTPELVSPEAPAAEDTPSTPQQEAHNVQEAQQAQEIQEAQQVEEIQEVQNNETVQELQGAQEGEESQTAQGHAIDDAITAGLSAEDLAQALRQLPEIDSNLQNDGLLQDIDLQDIDLLKDINLSDLKDLDLKDIDLESLQGLDLAEIISSLQSQQAVAQEHGVPSMDNSQLRTSNVQSPQETSQAENGQITYEGSNLAGQSIELSNPSNAEAVQPHSPLADISHNVPELDGLYASLTNAGNGQHQEVPINMNGTTNGHMSEGTAYQQDPRLSTDGGSIDFSALEDLDGAKLLEIQNAIQGFGGNEAFEQLLHELKNQPASAVSATETTTEPFFVQQAPNEDTQPVSVQSEVQSETENVNVDQIPQEAVSMSIRRLLDSSNFKSVSPDTQEQLMWLLSRAALNRQPQDEYGDEGDEGDDDKSKKQARIREENRERKKRWRESNQDRNKDNDLRCRVTKRAAKLYGVADTDEKRKWMEAEFSKRKEKREAKERARYHDDRISTSPCFGSYPQHHNHSGGTSATFSSSLQSLSMSADRDSSENSADFYGGAFRNRASSVAESTTSSINDGDGAESNGALRILSDPEAAQKLLQNSEAMELLSNNPEVLAFLQSVIESKKSQSPSEGAIASDSTATDGTVTRHPNMEGITSADIRMVAPIPEASPVLSDKQRPIQETAKPSIDISAYLELSEEELEEKLATMDPDIAQKVVTELIQLQTGLDEEAIQEATGPSTTPIEADMMLDPDVQRILDTPGDHHHDAGLDLTLVNDKLINFSAEDFSFSSLDTDDASNGSLDLSMMIDLGPEASDINAKLLQALQGALNINPSEQPIVLDPSAPPAPPSTPQKSNCKKRVAPTSEQPSVPRKRHQSSPTKILPELSPDTAQALANLLQNSGIDLQKLGATPAPTPPPPPTYNTNSIPRPIPNTTTAHNPVYLPSNNYNMPSTPPRPTIPKPPVTTSTHKPMSAAAAHAASFGNSAAMNQRLMPPPAYRPSSLGIGYGGFSPIPTIPKKKPDERIVKAMGFPPMLAGIKRKTSS